MGGINMQDRVAAVETRDLNVDLTKWLWSLQGKMKDFELCVDMIVKDGHQQYEQRTEALKHLQTLLDQDIARVLGLSSLDLMTPRSKAQSHRDHPLRWSSEPMG